MSEREAAEMIGVNRSTLMRWRLVGDDCPPYFVVPRPKRNLIRYPVAGLKRWLREKGVDRQTVEDMF